MSLLAWIPHFRTEYLAVYDTDCGCGRCKVAYAISSDELDEHDVVLQLKAFIAFGRPWRPRVTRIQ